MCRWFAYVSPDEECLLEDVLVTPAHALSKQVHDHYLPKLLSHAPGALTTEHEITARNRLFNVDGFGLLWYTSASSDFSQHPCPHPALYKSAQPPLHDRNFRSICANTATLACFAHIRAATGSAITSVNNHPFVFGRHTIMHNGNISDFEGMARELALKIGQDEYVNIQGSTDSEHFAALYMTYLTAGKGKDDWETQYRTPEMRDALHKAMKTVIELQLEKYGSDAKANNINVCVTDGQHIVAYRCRNHATEQPPSLYYSTRAGVTLNRKYPDHPDGGANPAAYKKAHEHGRHVIVASEPTTYKKEEWDLIGKNECLMVDDEANATIEKVDVPSDWNAEAATVGF